MESHHTSHIRFDPSMELLKRIELVMSVQKSLGHVSRKTLISTYGFTQQQAGSLMRDFIHAYAKNLQWDMTHEHYSMKS